MYKWKNSPSNRNRNLQNNHPTSNIPHFRLQQATMSTTITSFSSYALFKTIRLGTPNASFSSFPGTYRLPLIKHSSKQHVDIFNLNRQGRSYHSIRMNLNAANNIPSGGSPLPGWSSWVLLAIIPVILPFFSGKWGTLFQYKKKLDSIRESAATVAETIEDVAEGVDKLADEVNENLPEGSRLKEIVERIDHVAEQTIKGADVVEDILQEVEDVDDKLEGIIKDLSKRREEVDTEKQEISKDLNKGRVEVETKKEVEEK